MNLWDWLVHPLPIPDVQPSKDLRQQQREDADARLKDLRARVLELEIDNERDHHREGHD